jgi:hypothetical protein
MIWTGRVLRIAGRSVFVVVEEIDPTRELGPLEAVDVPAPPLAVGHRVLVADKRPAGMVIIGRLPA